MTTQKPKGNLLAGICFLLLAVSCLPVLLGSEAYVLPDDLAEAENIFIKLLPMAVYIYLGIVLLARRRGVWLFAGFLALAVMALGAAVPDPWFRIYFARALPGVNILNKMFPVMIVGQYNGNIFYWFLYPWYQGVLYAAAYLFAGIVALRKEKAQKLRMVPLILIAVSFVFMAFSVLRPSFNERFLGYYYVNALSLLLVVVFLVYLVLAAALSGTAVWCVYPNGRPVGRVPAGNGAYPPPPAGGPGAAAPRPAPPPYPYMPASYQPPRPQNGGQAADPTAELKKYKELLDMGAITQEEYDIKKGQLLGL